MSSSRPAAAAIWAPRRVRRSSRSHCRKPRLPASDLEPPIAGCRAGGGADDRRRRLAAHSAATAFFSWPEFGELLGGRFDEHPWGIADGTVVVDDPSFVAMRHMPPRVVVHDELYQIKDFSRERIHVLAHLDASKLDLT